MLRSSTWFVRALTTGLRRATIPWCSRLPDFPPRRNCTRTRSHLVTQFMKAFRDRCRERGYPPLDALVVHVAGERKGFPGAGYFKVNGFEDPLSLKTRPEKMKMATDFWRAEVQQCEEWGTRERRAGK